MSTRSASLSADDSSSAPLLKPSKFPQKSSGFRSASIGSSYFHKDSSTFFNHQDGNSVVDEETPSPVVETTSSTGAPALDLIGALGNLDLDDDFSLPKRADASPALPNQDKNQKLSNNPPSNQNSGNGVDMNYPFYLYPPHHHGSLTPNPNIGNFGAPLGSFAPINTPSNTWNNNSYIPSSAPPFSYGPGQENLGAVDSKDGSNNKNLLSVKPFELPESETDEAQFNSIQNLNMPFSSPPPPGAQFGGILDNQLHFGMQPQPNHPGQKPSTSSDKATSDSPEATEDDKSALPDQQAQPQHFHPELLNQFPALNDPLVNMMHPPPGNLWNQHGIMSPQLHHPGAMRNSFDNRLPVNGQPPHLQMGPGQFGGPMMSVSNNGNGMNSNNGNMNSNQNSRYSNNRRNNYDGMNIHRKMHNHNHHGNRRKGDDASKYANAKLEDFTGQIYSLCKDQHGCRFLQRQLDLGREIAAGKTTETGLTNDIAATLIFNEIYLKIIELMTDPFGNYLIQKLFENVSVDQRIILVKNASPDVIRIALDPHGTRALQKLVECISTEEESKLIIDSLSPHIVSLSRDLNGNHVVQKCLQKLKPQENQFIFEAACMNCNEIATHRHGCCVLQRCLDHGNEQQRKQLSVKVAESATTLSLDPFGNYVVQYVLSRGDDESISMILKHIQANVITLSLHKFGSNVIEKSLRISKLTDKVIDVLLQHKDKFIELLNDAFGNYVLQTSLDVANPRDLTRLSQALQPLLPNIKNTPHGRRIMTKIQTVI